MTEESKIKRYMVMALVVWALALAGTLFVEAQAGGNHNDYIECYQCVTNHVTEVTEIDEIYNRSADGLSDSDIINLSSSLLAGGSHQFDYSTTNLQLSLTGATTTSDWDEDTQFSFALAKRFGKDSWVPNALWHTSYTPDILGNDYVSFGALIVLDQR